MDEQGWWASLGSFAGGAISAIAGRKLWGTPRAEALNASDSERLTGLADSLAMLGLNHQKLNAQFTALLIRETADGVEFRGVQSTLERVQQWQNEFKHLQDVNHRENRDKLDLIREEIRGLRDGRRPKPSESS